MINFSIFTKKNDVKITNLKIKKEFFDNLNERQKRHYAAIEAKNLGYGGQLLVSKAFGIDPETIRRGLKELENDEFFSKDRIRKEGGGRKKKPK